MNFVVWHYGAKTWFSVLVETHRWSAIKCCASYDNVIRIQSVWLCRTKRIRCLKIIFTALLIDKEPFLKESSEPKSILASARSFLSWITDSAPCYPRPLEI